MRFIVDVARRRIRWKPLAAVVLAHAALFAWLSLRAPPAPPPEGRGVSVGLFDGAVLGAQAETPDVAVEITPFVLEQAQVVETLVEPPEMMLPSDLEPLFVMPAMDGPTFDAEPVEVGEAAPAAAAAAAGGGSGDACGLASDIVAALRSDATAQAAVARIPANRRSGGNAVMLWNGRWADLGLRGPDPIRAAVVRRLREASSDCREEAVNGPRLLAISGGPRPTFLAVGSGAWRWSDLLREDAASGK